MKNEIEKRQREDENNAKANQSTQEALESTEEELPQNGAEESTEPALTNGVANAAAKLVAC